MVEKNQFHQNSNYIWRVFFTFLIVTEHSGWLPNKGSFYLGVDYFFIIAGILLEKSINLSEKSWILKKIKKMYPYLAFNWLVFLLVTYKDYGVRGVVYGGVAHLNELIPFMYFVLPTNPQGPYLNYPVWYISVYMISGLLLHYLLRRHRDLLINVIAPISIILIYGYLARFRGSFNTGENIGLLNDYYLRGYADMCGGIIMGAFINGYNYKGSKFIYLIYRLLEIGLGIFLIYGMLFWGNSNADIFLVLLIYMIVTISFIYPNNGTINFDNYRWLNDLMYPVYICHVMILHLVKRSSVYVALSENSTIAAISVSIFILLVYALVSKKIIDYIVRRFCGAIHSS